MGNSFNEFYGVYKDRRHFKEEKISQVDVESFQGAATAADRKLRKYWKKLQIAVKKHSFC